MLVQLNAPAVEFHLARATIAHRVAVRSVESARLGAGNAA
jgi:hypothetical protein